MEEKRKFDPSKKVVIGPVKLNTVKMELTQYENEPVAVDMAQNNDGTWSNINISGYQFRKLVDHLPDIIQCINDNTEFPSDITDWRRDIKVFRLTSREIVVGQRKGRIPQAIITKSVVKDGKRIYFRINFELDDLESLLTQSEEILKILPVIEEVNTGFKVLNKPKPVKDTKSSTTAAVAS